MSSAQEQFDEAMFHFSRADYDAAIAGLESLLAAEPDHFDARLALGMAFCRKGDYARAIAEGHRAEQLRPREQLVHTNLSLFYMKAGDKSKAEHHGLQARLAAWKANEPAPAPQPAGPEAELVLSRPGPAPVRLTRRLSDVPWKKKTGAPAEDPPATGEPPPGQSRPD